MRKLMTFVVVVALSGRLEDAWKVEAHFMTGPAHPRDRVRFWVKPHWYSIRRCVAVLDWQFAIAVRNEANGASTDWLKEARVKL